MCIRDRGKRLCPYTYVLYRPKTSISCCILDPLFTWYIQNSCFCSAFKQNSFLFFTSTLDAMLWCLTKDLVSEEATGYEVPAASPTEHWREETDTASCSQSDSCESLISELDITWSLTPQLTVHTYTTRCCLSGCRQTDSSDMTRSNYMGQESARLM